jgi:hypothetical protein
MSKETEKPNLGPSLLDLSDENYKDPNFKTEPLDEESEESEEEEIEDKKPEKVVVKDTNGNEVELKTEESKDKDKESKDKPSEEPESDEFDFGVVNKLVGEEIEGEFTTDHEGIANYANTVAEKKIDKFEKTLEERFPREYQAFQMAVNGQDPSVLYRDQPEEDYTKLVFDDKDPVQHKQILNKLYALKDIDPTDAEELIKVATDKGQLAEKSKAGLIELHKYSDNRKAEQARAAEAKAAIYNKAINDFTGSVQEKIQTGQLGNLLIPEKDRAGLLEEFKQIVRYDEPSGKFYTLKELNPKDLDLELQAQYFKKKKGDLNAFIQRSAKTLKANSFKASVAKGKTIQTDSSKGEKGFSLREATEQ